MQSKFCNNKKMSRSIGRYIYLYLVGPYLASPNYGPALIWPRPVLAFGQLFSFKDSSKIKIKNIKKLKRL